MQNYSEQAARNFLPKLKTISPAMYQAAMTRLQQSGRFSLGQGEESNWWTDIVGGIKDVAKSAFDYQLSKEQARSMERQAQRQAELDIADMERQVELERRQLETIRATSELKRQQAQLLADEQRALSDAKRAVTAPDTLMVVGAGLLVLFGVAAWQWRR